MRKLLCAFGTPRHFLHEQAGQGEAEDGGDVGQGAVDLCFGGAPLVVDEGGTPHAARLGLGFGHRADLGAEARLGAAGRVVPLVGEQFVAVDAEELAVGPLGTRSLELAAQCAGQRTALHLPELVDVNARGVEFEGGTHRREEEGTRAGGHADEQRFVAQAVDGVDDAVVVAQGERVGGLGREDVLYGRDLGVGVDVEQTALEGIDLDLAYGVGRGHELAVDVGDADAVGVDDGETPYA